MVQLAYMGLPERNEAEPIVAEYLKLMRLKRLGYTQNLSDLDVYREACFEIIADEIADLQKPPAN